VKNFMPILQLEMKRRSKDFFIIFYNIIFPAIIILLLGYLTSKSYGTEFTSYEYYSIVMIPFCLLMAIISIAYAAQDEKRLKTAYRFMTAPIAEAELVLAKSFSCTIMLTICSLIILGIAKLFFHLSFHGSFGFVAILVFSESIAVTGIGLCLGLACKNFFIIKNFLNLPIMIFGFLGGVFSPVSSLNPVLSSIINSSPLTWINRGIIYSIYGSDHTILLVTSGMSFLLGIAAILFAIKFFKREEFF